MNWRSWLPAKAPPTWQSAVIGMAVGAVASGARVALMGPFGRQLPFLTLFPALVIASVWGGLAGGVGCLIVSTLAAVFVIFPEAGSLWELGWFWLAGGLVIAVAAGLSLSVRELRQSNGDLDRARSELQTLVGELAHRNRNALFVITAIVRQSVQGASSADEAGQIINARLEAMMRAQEVVVRSGEGADLRALLEKCLAPFDLDRFRIVEAPDVEVERAVATGLGLLLHELATNATKYGALSTPAGRVRIGWTADEGIARMTWREEGGPTVPASTSRRGFGTRLIEVALVPQGGGVGRRFEPGGVVCELRIPLAAAGAPPRLSTQYGERLASRLSSPD